MVSLPASRGSKTQQKTIFLLAFYQLTFPVSFTDLNNEGNDDSLEEIEVNVEQNLDDFLDGATQKRCAILFFPFFARPFQSCTNVREIMIKKKVLSFLNIYDCLSIF